MTGKTLEELKSRRDDAYYNLEAALTDPSMTEDIRSSGDALIAALEARVKELEVLKENLNGICGLLQVENKILTAENQRLREACEAAEVTNDAISDYQLSNLILHIEQEKTIQVIDRVIELGALRELVRSRIVLFRLKSVLEANHG